jgi:hypothetical protein
MSKAVVYMGADPSEFDEFGQPVGEWQGDEEVTDVTVAVGLAEIKDRAFCGCKGLTNLRFLKDSAVTTVGEDAFCETSIASLHGMERVGKIGNAVFMDCEDLRTIEGLGCEEMGEFCFCRCRLLQSMKGWLASMTVIPPGCFHSCSGMTTVNCDLSHVTSIGDDGWCGHAFTGCTSLLPPELSAYNADPAAVLTFLKRKSKDERARRTFLFSVKHAQSDYYNRTGDPCGASRRIIMEFAGLFPAEE